MKSTRAYALVALITLTATSWTSASTKGPSCNSFPCGAYKQTNINSNPSNSARIKLSFYSHDINKSYNASYAITQGNYAQMGTCLVNNIASATATMICFPPTYQGVSKGHKDGGLDDPCKGQSRSQCKIAKIELSLPNSNPNSNLSNGTGCTNPLGRPNCPPTGAPPQPNAIKVKVLNVEKGKSGTCKGCINLTTNQNFTVNYTCFDPGCC